MESQRYDAGSDGLCDQADQPEPWRVDQRRWYRGKRTKQQEKHDKPVRTPFTARVQDEQHQGNQVSAGDKRRAEVRQEPCDHRKTLRDVTDFDGGSDPARPASGDVRRRRTWFKARATSCSGAWLRQLAPSRSPTRRGSPSTARPPQARPPSPTSWPSSCVKDAVLSPPVTAAPADAVLVFDGVFLLRPELIERWDLRIFVSTALERTVDRAVIRERRVSARADIERRWRERYIPSQQLYFATARPTQYADFVVHNDEPQRPVWETARQGDEVLAAGE